MSKLFRSLHFILPLLLMGGLIFCLRFEHVRYPQVVLLCLLLIPLGWWLYHRQKNKHIRLSQWIEQPLLQRISPQKKSKKNWQLSLWLSILGCLIFALARPQGSEVLKKTSHTGMDILIAIDISDSMRAADIFPSRLASAKYGVDKLLKLLPNDRIGLMVFAGEAFPFAPFTHDHAALSTLLEDLDYSLVSSKTTNLEKALQRALQRFQRNTTQEHTSQVLVLISDGENQMGSYQDELDTLTQNGIQIFTIGTGTKMGARIPGDFLVPYKTWRGQIVKTRLDKKTLKKIATNGQGSYLPIAELSKLPQQLSKIRKQAHTRTDSTGALSFEERYQTWLLLALSLFLLEYHFSRWHPHISHLLTPTKKGPFKKLLQQILKTPSQAVFILMLPYLMSAWSFPWDGFWHNYQGQKSYESQKYPEAQEHFSKGLKAAPENPILKYNQGNGLYRSEQYEEAIQSYKEGTQAKELDNQQKSHLLYNLGNSYYRQGQKNQNDQETWKKAIEAYQQALKITPEDQDAQENLNFVQQQLEKKESQKDQSGTQDKNQKNKENQSQENQQNSGQENAQNNTNPSAEPPGEAPENYFSDQALQSRLQEIQANENKHRQQSFRRTPPSKQSNPIDELMRDDDSIKDW